MGHLTEVTRNGELMYIGSGITAWNIYAYYVLTAQANDKIEINDLSKRQLKPAAPAEEATP